MFEEYLDIKKEMELVYLHDKRPWMIGYSGGKDSTLLCCLVMEMLQRLPVEKRNKTFSTKNPQIKKTFQKIKKK